jgi:hypothetical protein
MGRIIDVESKPDLLHLVEELENIPEEHLLRWRGRVVAVVRPTPHEEADSQDADAAFRAAAGSWKDHLDTDVFVEENYRRRLVSTRRPVDF